MSTFMWWFLHLTGIDNPSGPWYSFWSGIGGTGVLGVIGGLFWRHHRAVTRHHVEVRKLLHHKPESERSRP